MKKNILLIIGVLFFSIAASAQVKTFKTVVEDEKIVVNHDNSFNHSFFVKNDDEIIIHMEWSPINVYVKNKFM